MKKRTVQLEEIAEIVQGGRLGLSGNQFVPHGFPAFGAGGLNGYLENYEFEGPAVILSSIGARCGKCFYTDGHWSSLANTQVIRPYPELADARFLWFQLNDEARWPRSGTGQPFIKPSDVKAHRIELPSLPEQLRIAGILEQAHRLRRTRRYALGLSDTFLPAAFLEMFGDPVRNPKKWEVTELGEQLDFLTSGSRGWAEFYADAGDLFLRIQNVGRGELILDDLQHVSAPKSAESLRTQVYPGDVLLSITADLGRSAWIPEEFPKAYINQHLALLRQTCMNPVFLATQIGSPSAKQAWDSIDRAAVKSGLNFADVRGFKIIVPPLALQQSYANLVREHERLREAQRESMRQAEHLFQSLLRRAFSEVA